MAHFQSVRLPNPDIKSLETLILVQKETMDLLGIKRTLWVVGGRMRNRLKIGYDAEQLRGVFGSE